MKYEVTVTLLPYCHNRPAKEQLEMSLQQVLIALANVQCSLIVEYKNGKCHYHALAEFSDHREINRFRYRLRKQSYLGRTTVSQIISEPNYCSYIRKDLAESKKIFDCDPILRDDFDIEHYICEHIPNVIHTSFFIVD